MTNVVVTFYKDKEALNLEYLELNILNLSKNLGYCTSLLLLWQPYPAVHYGLWAHWWMYSKLLYEVKIGYQVYRIFSFFLFFYKKEKNPINLITNFYKKGYILTIFENISSGCHSNFASVSFGVFPTLTFSMFLH